MRMSANLHVEKRKIQSKNGKRQSITREKVFAQREVDEILEGLEHDYEDAANVVDEPDQNDRFGVTKYLTLTTELCLLDDIKAQPVPQT